MDCPELTVFYSRSIRRHQYSQFRLLHQHHLPTINCAHPLDLAAVWSQYVYSASRSLDDSPKTVLAVVPQLILMIVVTVRYQKRRPHIWTANFREVQWFNGGGWPEEDEEKTKGVVDLESPALTKMAEATAEKRVSSDSIISLPPRYSFATSIASWNPSDSCHSSPLTSRAEQ